MFGSAEVLQRTLQGRVSAAVQRRGMECHRAGRVRLTMFSPDRIEADVRGTTHYAVTLWCDGCDIWYECDCPTAVDGSPCKHVWATAVESDVNPRANAFRTTLLQSTPSPQLLGASIVVAPQADAVRPAHSQMVVDGWRARTEQSVQQTRWRRLIDAQQHPAIKFLGNSAAETWYLIDLLHGGSATYDWRGSLLVLHAAKRSRLKRGGLSSPSRVGAAPDGPQPEGIEALVWTLARNGTGGTVPLSVDLSRKVLPELSRLGRLGAVRGLRAADVVPLLWDPTPPWRLVLQVEAPSSKTQTVRVTGYLQRQGEAGPQNLELDDVGCVLVHDLIVVGGGLSQVETGHTAWLKELMLGPLQLTRDSLHEMASALAVIARAPQFNANDLVGVEILDVPQEPRLRLTLPEKSAKLVRGTLTFGYGSLEVGVKTGEGSSQNGRVRRDLEAETASIEQLQKLGVSVETGAEAFDQIVPFLVKFDAMRFAELAPKLVEGGFIVEVEGRPIRRARSWSPIVESNQDWFDLEGDADFEGELATLPELLRAIRNKQQWVRLKDGSLGLLPAQWLDSLAGLAEFVAPRARVLRFHSSQASLVAGLLDGAANLQTDQGFTTLRTRFERFDRIRPKNKPRTFRGDLRDYQRVALGWLAALDELGFGGCLADDMGLGKTVVVLAWLEHQRVRRNKTATRKPSLLVVPKSLIFNWQRESERFTPRLSMLAHHGLSRRAPSDHFLDYDVVLTTYGTLRRDAATLSKLDFDYVVLDEAHNIKNAWTGSHQAACGLSSRRRLALTGTPLENHVGELWNLLTFLNPGVLESLSHLRKFFERRTFSRTALERGVLQTLGPFILRRTKSEVARDLPARIEKTLHVRLSKPERKLYDELAVYYQRRIIENRLINKRLKQAAKKDSGRATAEALEALLRLRQAACHPALLDDAHKNETSAKFEVLLAQLEGLRAEGHKALVFSQFTKLLGLLVPHLEAAGFGFAYLDGKTNDREAEVQRFGQDPNLSVFLISLKAGGVGLNLVAADYVFLLDPWWNPASEAQAIDRAHRIGQTNTVIAYRLLSEDTVEQKVAALQGEKRALAQAMFDGKSAFSAKFTREDLETLLGA
jgi:superfamily II DNA or RNA helicase